MAVSNRVRVEQEPLGIVISRGKRDEIPPQLWAYVWGPAPETESSSDSKAA